MINITRKKLFLLIFFGCLIAALSFGVRGSLGLFQKPIIADLHWNREIFALALAIQNLSWGMLQPVAGAIADRYGPARVMILGGVFYCSGLLLMSWSVTPVLFHLSAGLLLGAGIAFTSFTIVISALAKIVAPKWHSLIFGLGTAASSLGQVMVVPIASFVLLQAGWVQSLYILSLLAAVILPAALFFRKIPTASLQKAQSRKISTTLSFASKNRGYVLLSVGFFVCGFQVSFMNIHLPAYLSDRGFGEAAGAQALVLISLFNLLGCIFAGWVGSRYSKKISLAWLYAMRSAVILWFITAPVSLMNLYLFCILIGLLWLSTIPLTYGIVAQIFGPTYLGLLTGITFLVHQLGAFGGVFLGGYLFDRSGNYDYTWWAAIIFGLIAALLHLLIDERPARQASLA